MLADFVGAINEDWLYECSVQQVSYNVVEETIVSFASIPQTSSAVSLWLVKLDSLIAPYLEKIHSGKNQEISTRGKHIPCLSVSFLYAWSSKRRNFQLVGLSIQFPLFGELIWLIDYPLFFSL